MIELAHIQRVFFLGIGGIGMSAIARYFNHLGKEVFGYDLVETVLTQTLVKEGMEIHYTDDVSKIPDGIDLIVWTPAVPNSNSEYQYFVHSDIPMLKRAAILGIISREKKVIAVAGTHGKTTTSIMLSYLLRESGIDISAFLGGISTNYRSNFLLGNDDWVVMEADEYDRSFLQLFPEIIIVTSMDPDHLDIYGTHEEMILNYKKFITQINSGGSLIYHYSLVKYFDDAFLGELRKKKVKMKSYGMEEMEITEVLKMPGKHNRQNMQAAVKAAEEVLEIDSEIEQVIEGFEGIERRFEFLGKWKNWEVVSDYAHHPTEIKSAIEAARSIFTQRKITGVFQPHLYSRTKDFASEFGVELDELDVPILIELYPAREKPLEGISSDTIFKRIENKRKILTTKKKLINKLEELEIDVLLILGAGDLDPYIRKEMKLN